MKPHRSNLILVFGILGLVTCQPLGIFAWIMGSNDLKEMAMGRMDPSGRDQTNIGKICGMIAAGMMALGLLLVLVWLLIVAGVLGSAAYSAKSMPPSASSRMLPTPAEPVIPPPPVQPVKPVKPVRPVEPEAPER